MDGDVLDGTSGVDDPDGDSEVWSAWGDAEVGRIARHHAVGVARVVGAAA